MSENSLSKAYDPKEVENKWYTFWEQENLFHADPNSHKEPYCIILPPPNVTGSLHMGHALVDTVQDTLIRYKRMQGYEALWVPGVDHAGIATQTVVEKHLIATLGKRRKDFSREEFLGHVWSWKDHYEKNIISQLKKVGCSCDWNKGRFTMDEPSNKAVKKIFKMLFDQGLIYRGDYLVNWDPVTQTALADDEVEHEEKEGFLYHLKYELKEGNGSLVVATTRPETFLGDVAVAVNPTDPRYTALIGKEVILPLINRSIPIIADHYVDPSFGTGVVKITPAHDFNDYEVGLRHNLPMINIMTPDGHINEKGGEFAHLSMAKAREAVCDKLLQAGALIKKEPHLHRVGISYRSKAVIEPYLSKQWFVKMSAFKEKLLKAVEEKRVKMVPPHFEATYFHWIHDLRDWCISRQLWWGHQIPIWYHKEDPSRIICHDGDDLPKEVEENPSLWKQDEDVLDTWFSSALWPFSTLGWPEKTAKLKKFYPTSVLVTGHDILFFWVARMIMMGEYAMEEVPFHETFLHGLIYGKSYWKEGSNGEIFYLTQEEKLEYDLGKPLPKHIFSKWEKMSKSKGNVIDPLEIIDSYGADAMRMALLSSLTHARQIDLDRRKFEEFKNFANKLWNSARFVFMNLEASREDLTELSAKEFTKGLDISLLTLEDKWILNSLNQTVEEGEKHLKGYEFDKLSMLFYTFFWDQFCAYYLEIVKPIMTGKLGTAELRTNKQKILLIVLLSSIRLMHPLAPFITEEIFQKIKERFIDIGVAHHQDCYTQEALRALRAKACIVTDFPKPLAFFEKEKTNRAFDLMSQIIYEIRNIRGQMQLPPQTPCDIFISGPSDSLALEICKSSEHFLHALTKVKTINFNVDHSHRFAASSTAADLKITIPLPEELKEKEKQRLLSLKEKITIQIESIKKRLENTEFIEKAPKALVEKTNQELLQAETALNELKLKLIDLS